MCSPRPGPTINDEFFFSFLVIFTSEAVRDAGSDIAEMLPMADNKGVLKEGEADRKKRTGTKPLKVTGAVPPEMPPSVGTAAMTGSPKNSISH